MNDECLAIQIRADHMYWFEDPNGRIARYPKEEEIGCFQITWSYLAQLKYGMRMFD